MKKIISKIVQKPQYFLEGDFMLILKKSGSLQHLFKTKRQTNKQKTQNNSKNKKLKEMINKKKESNETKQQRKRETNDIKLSSQKEPIKFMNPE